MSPVSTRKPALITSARFSKSLDADARRTRYLWTMGVRVACFLGDTMKPLTWNLLMLLAAAVLPTIAVMLANAIDLRQPPDPGPAAPSDRPALPDPDTVDGTVVDEAG